MRRLLFKNDKKRLSGVRRNMAVLIIFFCLLLLKGQEASAEDPIHFSNCYPIVYYRNLIPLSGSDPSCHLFVVEHAAAAVDYQLVAGQVFGEVSA